LIAQGQALAAVNGETLNQIDVLQMITGSYQALGSALDSEIAVMKLAGESTTALEDFKAALEAAAAGAPTALQMIKSADILSAPAETAEKLAALAGQDAVSVSEYTATLIGSIQAEIDARKMFGIETKETEEALARFKKEIAATPTGWEKIEGFLGDFGGVIKKGLSQVFGEAGGMAVDIFAGLATGMAGGGWAVLISTGVDVVVKIIDMFAAEMNRVIETVTELANWIGTNLMQSFNWLVDKTRELTQSFTQLVTSTEVYSELQTTLNQVQSAIMNVLLGFLWPVVALLKEVFGVFDVMAAEAAVEIGVPTSWKRDRRAYESAAPGEPYTDNKAESGLPSWLSDIIEQFRDAIDAMLKPFKKFVALLEEAWQALTPIIFEGIIPAFTFFGESLAALSQSILDNLSIFEDNLPAVIQGALDFFFGAITGAATFFVDTLIDILPNLSMFMENIGDMGRQLPGLFASISDAISPVINTLLVGALIPLSAFIAGTLLPDLGDFFTALGVWWTTDVDPFLQGELFPTLGGWLSTLYGWIKDDLLPFLKNEVFPVLKNDVWPVVKEAFEGLGVSLGDLWGTIKDNMPTLTTFLTTFITDITAKWTGMVVQLDAYIQTKSGDLMGALETIWESGSLSLWDKLKTSFGLSAIALWDWMKVKLQPLWDAFGRLWDAISPVLIPAFEVLGGIIGGAFTVAVNVVTAAVDALALALDIVIYPFKLMGAIVYNLYVAVNNAIQYIKNLLNPFSSGNQLEYKPLPTFDFGGIIPGPIGSPQLVVGHGGEAVLTRAQQAQGSQVYNEVRVYIGDEEVTDLVVNRVQHRSKLTTGSKHTSAGLTGRYR